MHNIDGVFHFEALWLLQCHEYPESAFKTNIEGTFNILNCCIRKKIKKRFDFDKFNKLNKYFLGDKNNFISNGIEISSTCIDVLSIYTEIQKIEQNKCLENFFSSRFLLFLCYSFGEKHWVIFFKSVLKNFKVVNLVIISLRLISRKVKEKCAVY